MDASQVAKDIYTIGQTLVVLAVGAYLLYRIMRNG
jgi:hypothetical protein